MTARLRFFSLVLAGLALAGCASRPINPTPTSFVLSAEQVDRLRAAAGAAIRASPEFQRLLGDLSSPSPAAK